MFTKRLLCLLGNVKTANLLAVKNFGLILKKMASLLSKSLVSPLFSGPRVLCKTRSSGGAVGGVWGVRWGGVKIFVQ